MAKLVLIAAGTANEQQFIGDLVSIHDDNVELSGSGYANFDVIQIKDLEASQLITLLEVGSTLTQGETKFRFNLSALSEQDFSALVGSDNMAKVSALSKVVRSS